MAGEILWCHFPPLPALQPGPKPRPALAIEVREVEAGKFRVTVAYGTSQKIGRLHAGEFAIAPADGPAFTFSGLECATKFALGQAVELDYSDEWFKPPPNAPFGQNPKLGALHPSLVRRAAAAWKGVAGDGA